MQMRRKANEKDELDALFTQYAVALSFFERWQRRGVQNVGDIGRALTGYGDRDQGKLDWLREQIEMRTKGLGWGDNVAQWSSSKDENLGTISQLRDHLKVILTKETQMLAAGELPSRTGKPEEECPTPLQRKSFKALGTPTVQADKMCTLQTDLTAAEVRAAGVRRRAELELAGEIDWVCDRQPYATGQGPTCDKRLVGKSLEVRWRYWHKETGEPVYIWAEGEVVQVRVFLLPTYRKQPSDRQRQYGSHLIATYVLTYRWPMGKRTR